MRQRYIYLILVPALLVYLVTVTPDWQRAIGDAATAIVRPIVIPLVDLINVPAFVYIASALIVLSAMAASIAYQLRVFRPRMKMLRSACVAVQRLPVPEANSGGQAGNAMQELGSALRAHNLLPSAWAAFQTQLVREGGVPGAPFSTFAWSDPTIDEGERRGFMQALPGYFTSVGLIFTFVGLVVALYFAAKGFRTGNMDDARAAILQLLNASSFKFLTSVAALVAALIVSLAFRFSVSVIRSETEKTIGLIESYISLWRSVSTPKDTVQSQLTEIIQALNTLADSVSTLVIRADHLTKKLARQEEALRDAAE